MTALRLEAKDLVDEVPEEKLSDFVSMIKNFLKAEDTFYSEENQKYLRESIREIEEGKVVTFTDEEWEKLPPL